ncbi:hypothetical protein [Methanobacterium congolense]|uniref:Uncharacterized protein n=1 Tax=Methanobacterium congolense TaxID=118062 RepID=A0A1D3L239_9EURY|nr:hypothetical protein [Methanobacterium congolense]SCG85625.1 putative protein [Methanobacterium congolense]
MVNYHYIRGHKVCFSEENPEKEFSREYYEDTGSEVGDRTQRPCVRCGKKPDPEGYDACLGKLPGVKYACCGHGVEEGHIIFENGTTLKGCFTVTYRRKE